MINELELIDECKKAGVELISKPNGHYQLKGALLVNYYPFSKKQTAYVAGTKKGKERASIKEAISFTQKAPDVVKKVNRDQHKKGYRKKRRKMLEAGITTCFWCNKTITLDTSTIEHKIPLARGGLDNSNNRTLACLDCNSGRGHDMPELNNTPF